MDTLVLQEFGDMRDQWTSMVSTGLKKTSLVSKKQEKTNLCPLLLSDVIQVTPNLWC